MTTTREAALEAALKEIMSSDSYESRETFDGSSKHVVITKFGGFGQIAYEALAARPAPQPAGDTRGDCAAALAYASSLAETLHDKHYSRSVSWKPMPDLLGLLTQIDNMVAGIIGTATATPSDKIAEAALPDTALREAIGRAWCHEENVAKEMDADLAEAVLWEIRAIIDGGQGRG